jgi:hypothetical protein
LFLIASVSICFSENRPPAAEESNATDRRFASKSIRESAGAERRTLTALSTAKLLSASSRSKCAGGTAESRLGRKPTRRRPGAASAAKAGFRKLLLGLVELAGIEPATS